MPQSTYSENKVFPGKPWCFFFPFDWFFMSFSIIDRKVKEMFVLWILKLKGFNDTIYLLQLTPQAYDTILLWQTQGQLHSVSVMVDIFAFTKPIDSMHILCTRVYVFYEAMNHWWTYSLIQ